MSSNLKRFTAYISVDEEQLRKTREELDNSLSLTEMMENEFGWLHESGIYLDDIRSFRQRHKRIRKKANAK